MELVIVLIILVAIAFIILNAYLTAKRRKELKTWAESKGMRFYAGHDYSMEARFPDLARLREGGSRYAYNIMDGPWSGRPFLGFDYHYETHTHDSKGRRQTHHHYFSAVILCTESPLKPLFIRPEGFFDKITEFLGFDDIDFESAEFSRKFYVKANDKRWAYDVIHPRTMQFLLDSPQFTIQFGARHVMACRSSRFSTAQFDEAAQVLCGILDRMPDYLVQQLKEGC